MAPLPDFITGARQKSEAASGLASEFAVAAQTIPDQLKNIVNETLKANKDLYDVRSTALANFFAAPETGEAKFGVEQFSQGEQAGQQNPNFIFNPFERNKAIAEHIKTEEIPFLTANSLLGQVVGSGDKLIDAQTRQFESRAAAQQAAAQAARQTYQDTLSEYLQGEQLSIQKQELALKRAAAGKKSELDPFKQNEMVIDLVAGVRDVLAEKQSAGETVTRGDVDQIFAGLGPQLTRIGIDPSELNTWKDQAYSEFVTEDESTGGGSNFFSSLGNNLKNFVAPQVGVVGFGQGNMVDLSGPTKALGENISSFAKRGVSNASNFLQGFDIFNR